MALKDLVADHKQVSEEAIERIISLYVRYDPKAHRIVWTTAGSALGYEARILVYLTAVLGWQFVSDENVQTSTKPADIESQLGIPGNSLRPTLKRLKDTHLLAVEEGNYRVQLANLDAIGKIVAGATQKSSSDTPQKAKRPKSTSPKKAPKQPMEEGPQKDRSRTSSGQQLWDHLEQWVAAKYFDQPKGLSQVKERYHELGVIAKRTSLSGLMLRAVRKKLLARSRTELAGKTVWVYHTPQ